VDGIRAEWWTLEIGDEHWNQMVGIRASEYNIIHCHPWIWLSLQNVGIEW